MVVLVIMVVMVVVMVVGVLGGCSAWWRVQLGAGVGVLCVGRWSGLVVGWGGRLLGM
jgi:hypothetical protein